MSTSASPAERTRTAVVVEIADVGLPQVRVVVCAAVQLFDPSDPVTVVLCLTGVDEPTEEQALALQELCLGSVDDPRKLPDITLLGHAEAASLPHLVSVQATADDAQNARAVVLLTATAEALWGDHAAGSPVPGPRQPEGEEGERREASPADSPVVRGLVTRLTAERERARAMTLVARRDVRSAAALQAGRRRPHVVLVFQHPQYWGAVASLCEAFAAHRDTVDFSVVALDSPLPGQESTASFLEARGWTPRTERWLERCLDDVDVVILDNPYDELRPPLLGVEHLAAAGVRLVSVPYGTNAMGGALMDKMLWDLPLQRLAWRSYLASPAQRDRYEALCAAGAEPVRVLGTPKLDRVLAAEPSSWGRRLRRKAGGRPVVLWNPHFRVGEGGWSTFDVYLEPILQYFQRRRDAVLLLRPHFRLFPDLAAYGGAAAKVEATVRRFVAAHDNLVLDESPDYLEALSTCDAMLSDLSSLATELLPTGKPILYLRRQDGPGANPDAAYFDAMYQADEWADVERFLDLVRRGEDPQREARLAAVARHLPYADGRAGERVADDILRSLRVELALGEDPAPATPPPSPRSTAPLTVTAARLTPAALTLTVRSDGGPPRLHRLALRSPSAASPPAELAGGSGGAQLSLVQPAGPGRGLPLPTGTYDLVVEAREEDGSWAAAPWSLDRRARRALEGEDRADDRLRVTARVGAGELSVEVAVPGQVDTPTDHPVLKATYPAARSRPLEHAVLFTSYKGGAACNPLAVQRELHRRGHDAKHYWVVEDHSVPVPEGAVPVVLGSREFYERAATARWLVDNEAMPVWVTKRRGQVCLQTWHGTPLKRLRWDIDEIAPRDPAWMEYMDRDAQQWDAVVSPNPLTTEVLRRGFRYPGQVLETGYPRNDVLARPDTAAERGRRTRELLGLPEGQQVVLYAPTWRDNAMIRSVAGTLRTAPQPDLDYAALRARLGPDVAFLYRGHRFVAGLNRSAAGVLDVTRYPDMADLLACADVLVTDYSSSMFDFALTGRPMVFFAYDLETYRDHVRGFYFDMEARVPGPVVRTAADVADALADLPASTARYAERYAAFRRDFAPWEDGRAAERVVDAIFG